jgi:hypothetical protein
VPCFPSSPAGAKGEWKAYDGKAGRREKRAVWDPQDYLAVNLPLRQVRSPPADRLLLLSCLLDAQLRGGLLLSPSPCPSPIR